MTPPAVGMRHFRFLVAGSALSSYGSYLNMVALNLFAYQITGSALQTGLFMALRLTASVVGGGVAGTLAARFDRKRLMISSDLTQATALLALVLAPVGVRSTLLYALAVITGLTSTCTSVALRSAIPEIVGAEQRVAANALLVTWRSMAMVVGFASAGAVVSWLGFTAAFVVDAGTFLISAANLALLPLTTRQAPSRVAADPADARPTATHRVALTLLRATPLLMFMMAIRGVDGLGSSSHNVGLPIRSTELDPDHPAIFLSQFWATWAIGNIVAQQAVRRLSRRRGYAPGERAFALGVIVMSASFILTFVGLPTPVAIPVMLVAGMADGFTDTAYTSRLQSAPDAQRAQLFGMSAMVENLGFGVGMVLSASLLERFSALQVVTTMHGAATVVGLCFLAVLLRSRRSTARGRADPAAGAADGARDTATGGRVEEDVP